jgi:acyl carrier protein
MNPIQRELHVFLTENFAIDQQANPIGLDESLVVSGVVDSTGLLELVSFVETTYGLEIPDEDLLPENFETIARVSAYITARVPAGVVAESSQP